MGNWLDVPGAPKGPMSWGPPEWSFWSLGVTCREQSLAVFFLRKPGKGFDGTLFPWCPGTFLFFTSVLSTQ